MTDPLVPTPENVLMGDQSPRQPTRCPTCDAWSCSCAKEDAPACLICEGSGEIFVRRNSRGQIDYIDGSPTGELVECYACYGTGVEQ